MSLPVPAPKAQTNFIDESADAALATLLEAASSAADCLELANRADASGLNDVVQAALEKAVALDRHCVHAMIGLAAVSIDEGDRAATAVLLEETARIAPLPTEVESLRQELYDQTLYDESARSFYRSIGRISSDRTDSPLSILIVTNLFPPQELGGYGRMMWEFAHGLRTRGHQVRVLTANLPHFAKPPGADEEAMEAQVVRNLELQGTWIHGRAIPLSDRDEIQRRLRDNAARVRTAVARNQPDLILAGNLDFLGISLLRDPLSKGVRVLHALANAAPGFSVAEEPLLPNYWVAACSDWNGQTYRAAGYQTEHIETLYPGARVDRFLRLYLPAPCPLRICYASIVLPYKGVDVLVEALIQLHQQGVPFTAEIAGDSPDPEFLRQLKGRVEQAELSTQLRFAGFLDRTELVALFARNNVLVFPSCFEEPFGIAQVEAMASGLVVVSSGTGGAAEVVRDGIDGLLFPAGDVAGLVRQLRLLAAQPELSAQLQRNAQARAVELSVDRAVRRIEDLAAQMHQCIENDPLTANQMES